MENYKENLYIQQLFIYIKKKKKKKKKKNRKI